jgi:KaiC/GvpD/RAD55 family RecA-like ATPase
MTDDFHDAPLPDDAPAPDFSDPGLRWDAPLPGEDDARREVDPREVLARSVLAEVYHYSTHHAEILGVLEVDDMPTDATKAALGHALECRKAGRRFCKVSLAVATKQHPLAALDLFDPRWCTADPLDALRQLLVYTDRRRVAASLHDKAGKAAEATTEEALAATTTAVKYKPRLAEPDAQPNDLLMGIFMRATGQAKVNCLDTGVTSLDAVLAGGLYPADLVVIAAESMVGKTSLAMQIVAHALKKGLSAGIFTLEMSTEALTIRVVAALAGLDQEDVRAQRIVDQVDCKRLSEAMEAVKPWDWRFCEQGDIRIDALAMRAAEWHAARKLDVVLVDYLQKVKPVGRHGNREGEVAEVSRDLKALAKRLNCPVIAISPVNEAGEVRESKGIKYDADTLIYLKRENPNLPTSTVASAIIGKARNGKGGVVPLHFDGPHTRFENAGGSYTAFDPRAQGAPLPTYTGRQADPTAKATRKGRYGGDHDD